MGERWGGVSPVNGIVRDIMGLEQFLAVQRQERYKENEREGGLVRKND